MFGKQDFAGYVRIEVLILIFILVLGSVTVLLAWSAARVEARDQRRITDITQIEQALSTFFTENGFYPYGNGAVPASGITENYLEYWPQVPKADGNCTDAQNNYSYVQKEGGLDFSLSFCLGRKYSNINPGPHVLTSKGIQ